MKSRIPVPPSLRALIKAQAGVFSSAQAEMVGVTRTVLNRMRREGHWHPVTRGVWSTLDELPWLGNAWTGVLLADGAGVLGGQAAAHLWGFAQPPEVIDIWSESLHGRRAGPWRFRIGAREPHGDPPRVQLAQAVLECCAVPGLAPDDVVGVLTRALGTRKVTSKAIRAVVEGNLTQPNRGLMLDVLAATDQGVESPLELRYARDVEAAHGLPRGERQRRFSQGRRTDVGYIDFGLLVELDGRAHHKGLVAHSDMDRDNDHLLAGLRTLRFGWKAVAGTPCRVAVQVGGALQLGGWTGSPQQCKRCRDRKG